MKNFTYYLTLAIAFIFLSNSYSFSQDYIMGAVPGNSVTTCGGTIFDPGGTGNYGNNQDVTLTICPDVPNSCIQLTFISFQTENSLDRLTIYNGSSTAASVLGVFSGNTLPTQLASNSNSDGCITLRFQTDGSVTFQGFEISINCVPCTDAPTVPDGTCEGILPACADGAVGVTFPTGTNVPSPFVGPVSCLFTSPNPAWYYVTIENSGSIQFTITSGGDVDFILWGPFTQTELETGAVCTSIMGSNGVNNVVDCSYSAAAVENVEIPNAIISEVYVLMITNFANINTNINFNQTGGTGTTNCDVFCDIAPLNSTVSACDDATNLYSVSGNVEVTNPPASGTLTIALSNGSSVVLDAPFPAVIPYMFDNLASDGLEYELVVSFSANGTCVEIFNYTAPATCSVCPVFADVDGPACDGQSVSLTATVVDGATYSWTGPNGFTSTEQNPVLTNVTPAMSGEYVVTATNATINCQSVASVNVVVFPTPATPVIASNSPICSGQTLQLTGPAIPGATYEWVGPNGFSSTLQSPPVPAAIDLNSGDYSLRVTINTCPSLPSTLTAEVYPYPPSPVLSSNGPICAGTDLELYAEDLAGATFSWSGPNGFVSGVQNPVIAGISVAGNGTYTAILTLNGCPSEAVNLPVVIYPIPPLPVLGSNSPVCERASIELTGPAPSLVGTTYAWTGPNGFTGDTQNLSIDDASIDNVGIYSLIITENGCASPEAFINILLTPLPVPDAGEDITICSQQPGQLGAAPAVGLAYSWFPSTGLTNPIVANPIVLLSNVGGEVFNTEYTLTVTNLGCSSEDKVIVTVNPQPVAAFTAPNAQCFRDNSFDFSAEGVYSSDASFEWNFGIWASVDTSFDTNPSDIQFNSTGLQMVRLVISDRGCVSNPYTAPVMVNRMPVANFDSDIYTGCAPEVVNFTNLSVSDDIIKTLRWDFGNEKTASNQNPIMLYTQPGNYTVSLEVTTDKGCVDVYEVPQMVRIFPKPSSDFLLDPYITAITEPEILIEDHSNGADDVVYFIGGSLSDTLYGRDVKYTFQDTGVYPITQIVSNDFGCADTIMKEMVVEFGYKVYIPSAFTPNNDGLNDRFRIYGEDITEARIRVFSRWGELMYTSFDLENGWDGTMRLRNEPAPGGMYVYEIDARDKIGRLLSYQGTVVLLR
jgi:gliding motility-associated-like protein